MSKTKSFEVPSRDALFAVMDDAASALERPHLVLPRPESDPYFSANEMRRAMALQALVRLWSVAGELALDAGDTAGGLAILRRGITLADRMVLAGSSCVVSQLILSAWALAALANALGPRPAGAGGDPTVAWPPTGWTVEQQGLWRALLDDLLHSLANPQLDAAYHAAEGLGFAAPSWLSPGWQAHPKPPLRWLQNDELHTAWLRRRVTAAVVEESVLPHYLRRMDRVRAAARDSGWRRWYNHYGHWLVGTYYAQSAPTRLSLLDRYRHSRHRVALAIALKLFNERHARMPAVWEEVVADGLLADVPLDPFDGEPVRFDAAAGRLWFVGKRWGEADEGQRWNWLRSMPPEQRREMETPEGLQQRPHPENLDLAWLAEPQEQQREPVVTSADGSDWWLAFTKQVMGKEMAEKERQAAGLA